MLGDSLEIPGKAVVYDMPSHVEAAAEVKERISIALGPARMYKMLLIFRVCVQKDLDFLVEACK